MDEKQDSVKAAIIAGLRKTMIVWEEEKSPSFIPPHRAHSAFWGDDAWAVEARRLGDVWNARTYNISCEQWNSIGHFPTREAAKEALERWLRAIAPLAAQSPVKSPPPVPDRIRRLDEATVSTPQYPEHEKLKAVAEKSQACGEFLAWLLETYTLGTYHVHSDGCRDEDRRVACGSSQNELYPTGVNTSRLLAEFFKIDEVKLEEEKRTMLDELRGKTP